MLILWCSILLLHLIAVLGITPVLCSSSSSGSHWCFIWRPVYSHLLLVLGLTSILHRLLTPWALSEVLMWPWVICSCQPTHCTKPLTRVPRMGHFKIAYFTRSQKLAQICSLFLAKIWKKMLKYKNIFLNNVVWYVYHQYTHK